MSESGRPLTPEQLIALNEEIATLVMAGVPLELGLRALGSDVPSVLGRVSQTIAIQLQAGQSLPDALQTSIPGLPRIYLAAVEAGMRSGQLPRTLELLCRFLQQGLDLRQRIEFAFLYPLLVMLLAYGLFVTFVIESVQHWTELWGDIALQHGTFMLTYQFFCLNWPIWVGILPALVLLTVGCWFWFGRRSLMPDRRPSLLVRLIPGLHGVIRLWHWSIFCETSALLIEHQVTLPEALRLSGATTGNPLIDHESSRLAECIEQGKSAADSLRDRRQIPTFLRWVLSNSTQPTALLSSLRQAAGLYYERAQRRAEAIKTWLPLGLIVLIGGGAVLLYALTCLIPIINMIGELTDA
ncbi:MAG: gspF [Planctomycetaceae bacterium]|nr:gspF [Planctomycetaceae bacterium]